MEEPVGVQTALKQKHAIYKKCHIMDVVVPSQIDSSKFAQQNLIHIAKLCRSQQVNETVEGLTLVLELNISPVSQVFQEKHKSTAQN